MWNPTLVGEVASNNIPAATHRLRKDARGFFSTYQSSSSPHDAHSSTTTFPQIDVSRVSQLDAAALDTELSRILNAQVERIVQCLPTHYRTLMQHFKPETDCLLAMLVWFFTIRRGMPTPGCAIQNLRYRNEAPFSTAPQFKGLMALGGGLDAPTRAQRFSYLVLSVFVPYVWIKINEHATEARWEHTAETRWIALEYLDKSWRVAYLTNLLAFLAFGKYRSLVDRCTRMRLIPARNEAIRTMSFEMVNQQLLMEGFSEMLLVLLPLINWMALRRFGSRWMRYFKRKGQDFFGGSDHGGEDMSKSNPSLISATEMECAACGVKPPVMSHRLHPCCHIFCYYCIKVPTSSSSATCPTCDAMIETVERL